VATKGNSVAQTCLEIVCPQQRFTVSTYSLTNTGRFPLFKFIVPPGDEIPTTSERSELAGMMNCEFRKCLLPVRVTRDDSAL